MLRPLFFTALLLACCAPAFAQNNDWWKLPGTRKANPPEAGDWHKPEVACALLDGLDLKTRGYKNDPSAPTEYFCSAPYTQIDNRLPFWMVFIAYYVDGTRDKAKQLKAVVSIHDRRVVELGHAALALAGAVLTKRALNVELPNEIANAIDDAETGRWKVGSNQIEIQREDYVNGWGYDLKFIIR